MRISLLLLAVFALTGSSLKSQDLHFSQFFNSPLNKNPALTGIFNGDQRIGANYRHQWYSVPVPYLTFSGSYDQKFYNASNPGNFFSGGLLLNYDKSGDSRMVTLQAGLSVSYTVSLNENNLITAGLQGSYLDRSFHYGDNLQWDNQFDGLMFNPGLSSGEPFEEGRHGFSFGTIGAGVNYRWQQTARTNVNIGGAIHQFNTPEHTFYDDGEIDWPNRFSIVLASSFQLSELLDLKVKGLAQFQGPAHEYVPGLLLSFHINRQRGREFTLDVGGMVRLNDEETDAIIPMLGFEFNSWYVGVSYDITLSDFKIATQRYGGPEISFRYIISKVRPLNNFKTCPIF
jgi:type IX secretion system PorP/SprF family membrane protein